MILRWLMVVPLCVSPGVGAIDLGTTSEQGSTYSEKVLGRKSFGTEDAVAEGTVNTGCIEYCYTGVCIWVRCSIFGDCDVETSEKVGHTSPDFVVSSYRHPGENPWTEAKTAYGSILKTAANAFTGLFSPVPAGGGMNWRDHNAAHREEDPADEREQQRQLWFKETAVIGNPLIDLHREIIEASSLHACPVDIDEFQPYYQSEVDAISWRGYSPLTMLHLEAWIPGMREIGTSALFTWGSVYPRIGALTGTEGPKVAAVAAQRAIDITTREDQMRVYTYPYEEVSPPNYRDPSNEQTDRWLMIHPAMEHKCYTFGKDPDYAVIDAGTRNAEYEDYGYLYWGWVECCEPVDGYVLVETIDIEPICVSLE